MSRFNPAPAAIVSLVEQVMRDYCPELHELGITVRTVMAHAPVDKNGVKKGPAIVRRGVRCLGTIKPNNTRDRLEGKADASMLLDGDEWLSWSAERRIAVIHHELYHLEIRRNKQGVILTDDAGRPSLKSRPHDWEIGGFDEIIRIHGDAAVEKEAIRTVVTAPARQVFFDFMPRTEPPRRKVDRPQRASSSAF